MSPPLNHSSSLIAALTLLPFHLPSSSSRTLGRWCPSRPEKTIFCWPSLSFWSADSSPEWSPCQPSTPGRWRRRSTHCARLAFQKPQISYFLVHFFLKQDKRFQILSPRDQSKMFRVSDLWGNCSTPKLATRIHFYRRSSILHSITLNYHADQRSKFLESKAFHTSLFQTVNSTKINQEQQLKPHF